jgi:predicted MFS family arabinose efflux permease
MSVPERQFKPPAKLIWLLTAAAAVSVANLYYNQPLLPEIARSFHVSAGAAGVVATATQIGYAIGMLLFVPLGDTVERRRLIVTLASVVAVALAAAAASPSLPVLIAASLAIGVTNVVPQLIIPFAAGMTSPGLRGRVVGQVMSGLLIGILMGRVVAGVLANATGWRTVFGAASVTMLALALLLRWLLPFAPPAARKLPYRDLLRSLIVLFRDERVIRDAALMGAMSFASFSAFWTTLAFRLREPPLHYGSDVAGAFGLLGVVGAAAAPIAGRLADRRSARAVVGYALWVNVAAWLVMLVAGHSLLGIAVGVLLLDAGTQAAQVSNQARVYALPAEAHGRFNTIYMVCYFVGGAAGSAIASAAWSAFRWNGVCGVALVALAVALLVHRFHGDGGSGTQGNA